MINTLFKSENEKNKNIINRFYVSNPEPFIKYIKINDLYFPQDTKNFKNHKI